MIFIQIASYRDPQLIPTLLDLITQSSQPHTLRIVVCWQHAPDETLSNFCAHGFVTHSTCLVGLHNLHTLTCNGAVIDLIDVPHHQTRGACWARNLIQQHYRDEQYTLQLDSHHRFVPQWDTLLIEMLESLRDVSPKPLLTTYLPVFDPDIDPAGRGLDPSVMHFDRFTPEGVIFFLPAYLNGWEALVRPVLARFYSAHFAFADGHFAREVQHDPHYFFHGEEISIAVRAFTHGYDLYHPHRLIAWHEYTRKGRVKMWDDHTLEAGAKGEVAQPWYELNTRSHLRNRILFGMEERVSEDLDFGPYGFGSMRTLAQYEAYAGVSFAYRGVQPDTLNHEPPVLDAPVPDVNWFSSLLLAKEINLSVHQSLLGELSEMQQCQLNVYTADGTLLHQKNLNRDDFLKRFSGEYFHHKLDFVSANRMAPANYVLELIDRNGKKYALVEQFISG